MTDTIKLPGVGPVNKHYAIAFLAGGAGILGYAWWKRAQTPAAAPADTTSVDSSTPVADTGSYVEGSSALGYNTVDLPQGGYAPYGYDLYGNPIPPPTGAGSNGVFTTNSDWASAAESALEDGGVTLAASQLAISRVLGGLSVNSSQRDIFMQAIGLLGQPPQGYPQPIKLTDTGTGAPPPPGGTLPGPTGLKAAAIGSSTVTLTWNKVTGAASYHVYDNHSSWNVSGTADTTVHIGDLDHNATYRFHVRAVDSAGHLGNPSATITVKTKK